MNMKKKILIIIVGVVAAFSLVKKRSGKIGIDIGPASINKTNVTVYNGPHSKSQKIWKLHKKNWPVYILEISKNWVHIVDAYNTCGWVKKIDIGIPYVLVLEDIELHDKSGKLEVKILKNSMVQLAKQISISDASMVKIVVEMNLMKKEYWVPKSKIWNNAEPIIKDAGNQVIFENINSKTENTSPKTEDGKKDINLAA